MALRRGKLFDTTPQLRLNLQTDYDIETARMAIGPVLDAIDARSATVA